MTARIPMAPITDIQAARVYESIRPVVRITKAKESETRNKRLRCFLRSIPTMTGKYIANTAP